MQGGRTAVPLALAMEGAGPQPSGVQASAAWGRRSASSPSPRRRRRGLAAPRDTAAEPREPLGRRRRRRRRLLSPRPPRPRGRRRRPRRSRRVSSARRVARTSTWWRKCLTAGRRPTGAPSTASSGEAGVRGATAAGQPENHPGERSPHHAATPHPTPFVLGPPLTACSPRPLPEPSLNLPCTFPVPSLYLPSADGLLPPPAPSPHAPTLSLRVVDSPSLSPRRRAV